MDQTNAERQRRYRERRKAKGLKRDWVKQQTVTAATIAKERLEECISEKVGNEYDLSVWEFYTYLFNQAKAHKVNISGYASLEYQADQAKAKERKDAETR